MLVGGATLVLIIDLGPEKRTMLQQVFWILAGAWNMVIATALWNDLNRRDKKMKENKLFRALVFTFGVGYILVGYYDWLWWFIILGMVAKVGVVLDYFANKFDYEKLRPDLLTYIVIGDLLWVFAFGISLGLRLSANARRNRI